MSSLVVVDASVAVKWVIREPDSYAALELVARHRLAAPELLAIECTNAIWLQARKRRLTPVEARGALVDLLAVAIDFTPDHLLAPAAMSLAVDLDHPAYDCAYLALAIDRAAPVVTADRRFAASVRRHPFLADRIRLLEEVAA